MKTLIIILIMLPTIILNSCTSAKRSSDVQIARVSSVPYLKMTCAELGTERRIVLERLDAARSKVDSEYDSEDENSFDEEIAEKFGEIDNDISKTNKALKELRE